MKKVNIDAFIQTSPCYIKQFPRKWESKRIVLSMLVSHITTTRTYTEKEITTYLSSFYDDPVELRRYLIDFHFMTRTKDGKCYSFLDLGDDHETMEQ